MHFKSDAQLNEAILIFFANANSENVYNKWKIHRAYHETKINVLYRTN